MNTKIEVMVYEVGKVLPEIANGESIGVGAKLEMNEQGALSLYCPMPGPSPKEIKGFKTLKAIGLYQTPEFKQGLWLWQFEGGLIVESPFNPSLYSDGRVERMGEANLMHRYLVDERGILRSMNVFGLYADFLATAKAIWTNPQIKWDGYSESMAWLYSNYSTNELWRRVTRKWACTNNADNN